MFLDDLAGVKVSNIAPPVGAHGLHDPQILRRIESQAEFNGWNRKRSTPGARPYTASAHAMQHEEVCGRSGGCVTVR